MSHPVDLAARSPSAPRAHRSASGDRLGSLLLALALLAPAAGAGEEELVTAAPHPPPPAGQSAERWTLQRSMGLPSWFELSVEQQVRFEQLNGEFRAGAFKDDNQGWAIRNLVKATIRGERWRATGELADARVAMEPDTGFIDTSMVNTLEPIQLFVGHTTEGAFEEGDRLDVRVGRQTVDIGGRRLLARNIFRSTINAFTGVHAIWNSAERERLHAFALVPQQRLPTTAAELRDNEQELDDELEDTRFVGVLGARPVGDRSRGELYLFGLDESDQGSVATRDRELLTFGGRLVTPPSPGETSMEWESIVQVGESRSSTAATNTTDLTHQAHYHHLSFGYQWQGEQRAHLEFLFDYASGDRDPTDSSNNRFDTLYGIGRPDFNPTGMFNAFRRANLISPGLRLTTSPFDKAQLRLAARQGWLASRKDAWVGAGLQDPAGDSGRNIGQLLEARLRVDVVPGTFQLEFGAAHLFAGSFVEDAPNNTGQDDSTYVYGGWTLRF